MRRRLKRKGLYIWLIHTAVWQKPIQHGKAIILQWGVKKKITTLLSVTLDFPSDPLWNVVTLQITGPLAAEGLMQQIWGGAWGTYNFSKFLRSLASLVAQTVKRLPAMQETRVWSLGWEDPWRRKWQPTPALLPGKSHGWRSLIDYSPWGHKESDKTERLHSLRLLW